MDKYILQHWAEQSIHHAEERTFLKILEEFVSCCDWPDEVIPEDENEPPYFDAWTGQQWRDAIVTKEHPFTTEHFDQFDEWVHENITEFAEQVASVGYDLYGMAHSGFNAVYRFLGVYFLRGSDYIEGPTLHPGEIIKYLKFTDEDGFDCYIDPDYESYIEYW